MEPLPCICVIYRSFIMTHRNKYHLAFCHKLCLCPFSVLSLLITQQQWALLHTRSLSCLKCVLHLTTGSTLYPVKSSQHPRKRVTFLLLSQSYRGHDKSSERESDFSQLTQQVRAMPRFKLMPSQPHFLWRDTWARCLLCKLTRPQKTCTGAGEGTLASGGWVCFVLWMWAPEKRILPMSPEALGKEPGAVTSTWQVWCLIISVLPWWGYKLGDLIQQKFLLPQFCRPEVCKEGLRPAKHFLPLSVSLRSLPLSLHGLPIRTGFRAYAHPVWSHFW
jgi:hypothetical protein